MSQSCCVDFWWQSNCQILLNCSKCWQPDYCRDRSRIVSALLLIILLLQLTPPLTHRKTLSHDPKTNCTCLRGMYLSEGREVVRWISFQSVPSQPTMMSAARQRPLSWSVRSYSIFDTLLWWIDQTKRTRERLYKYAFLSSMHRMFFIPTVCGKELLTWCGHMTGVCAWCTPRWPLLLLLFPRPCHCPQSTQAARMGRCWCGNRLTNSTCSHSNCFSISLCQLTWEAVN